jgi:hypothetical protein
VVGIAARTTFQGTALALALCANVAAAADPDAGAELAKQLANPIASLISVPFKLNWDTSIGPANADRYTLNIQPVIPLSLGHDWNLISRTIVPIVDAQSPVSGGSHESGSGDILQSFFFSPKAPTAEGWIWGAGPVLLLRSASNDAIGGEKWGAGPTAVLLKQAGGWTYGALANHLWSFAGASDRANVRATFLQPFLSYTMKTATTYTLNTESTYDWNANQWTVPVNLTVSQLMRFGKQPVSFAFGVRGYAERPAGGPDWGLTLTVTFLFPK